MLLGLDPYNVAILIFTQVHALPRYSDTPGGLNVPNITDSIYSV